MISVHGASSCLDGMNFSQRCSGSFSPWKHDYHSPRITHIALRTLNPKP